MQYEDYLSAWKITVNMQNPNMAQILATTATIIRLRSDIKDDMRQFAIKAD